MRSSLKVSALVLAAAVGLTVPAMAQGYGPHGHVRGDGPGLVAHMAKALDLTDDQQVRIRSITANYRAGALGDTMHAMRKARFTLRQTIHNLDATDQQVQEAAAAVATLDSQLAVEQHRMAVEIGNVLTADQRTKLAQMKNGRGDDDDDGPPPPPDGNL